MGGIPRHLLAAALIILWPALSRALTINIGAGQLRGGLGDIASNLRMAQKLKNARPDAEINVIVDATNSPLVERLLAGQFDLNQEHQLIDGVHYYRVSRVPRADYVLMYSAIPRNFTDPIMNSADTALVFQEYGIGELDQVDEPLIALEKSATKGVGPSGKPGVVYFYQSGATRGGFYISPEKPAPPLTRSLVFDRLKKDLKHGSLPENSKIAFSYTATKQKTLEYVKAMSLASRPGNPVTLIVRDFPELSKLKLPADLHLLRYESIPFALAESVIAHSDLPIMVTGDVSMTLALEYEKPFFYEMNTWKKEALRALAEKMRDHGGAPQLEKMLGLSPMSAEEMAAVIHATDQQNAFTNSLVRIRKTESLPAKTLRHLSALEVLDARLASRQTAETMMVLVEKHGSVPAAIQAAVKSLYQKEAQSTWVSQLRTLASLRLEQYPELPSLLESLTRHSNPELAQQARLFIDYRKSEPGWKSCPGLAGLLNLLR